MKLFKLSAIALALVSASAFAAPSVDANLELDNQFHNNGGGATQSGRVELNIGQKFGTDAFVQGKASFLAKRNGAAATDDMWIKFGTSTASIQLGAFEAADLFPLGNDTQLKTADGAGYRASALRGRNVSGNANNNALHAAVGFNLSPAISAELGLIETKTGYKGIRPTIKTSLGMFSVGAGFEMIKDNMGGSDTGFGLTAGFKLAGGDINANFAKLDAAKSIGLNGTFGPLGLGYVQDKGTVGGTSAGSVKTLYAAYKMSLMGIPGAFVTPAVSTSKATGVSGSVNGLNVRFNYGF
jgi:Porin-like glycoporin RafY